MFRPQLWKWKLHSCPFHHNDDDEDDDDGEDDDGGEEKEGNDNAGDNDHGDDIDELLKMWTKIKQQMYSKVLSKLGSPGAPQMMIQGNARAF